MTDRALIYLSQSEFGGRVTPSKPVNADAITQAEAAEILGLKLSVVGRLIRNGVLARIPHQFPSMSRRQVEEHLTNPKPTVWITLTEAAAILDVSKTRAGQIADKGLLPFEIGPNGRRRYRRQQVEVISRARQIRWHSDGSPVGSI